MAALFPPLPSPVDLVLLPLFDMKDFDLTPNVTTSDGEVDYLKSLSQQQNLMIMEQQRLFLEEKQAEEDRRLRIQLEAAEAEARRIRLAEEESQKSFEVTFQRGRALIHGLESILRSLVNPPENFFIGHHNTEVAPYTEEYKVVAVPFLKAQMKVFSAKVISNPTLNSNFHSGLLRMHGRSTNILFLYHTSRANPTEICEDGLLMSTSTGGSFGRGLYFSDDPKKSNEYWGKDDKIRYMFIFAVAMGNVQRFGDGITATTLKKSPPGFDSVAGRVPREHGLFNEYVVYRENQCLPRYLVEYSFDPITDEEDWSKTRLLNEKSEKKRPREEEEEEEESEDVCLSSSPSPAKKMKIVDDNNKHITFSNFFTILNYADVSDITCSICSSDNKYQSICELKECKHVFHTSCITSLPSYKSLWLNCPICNFKYGVRTGDQPEGTMDVQHYPVGTHDVAGCDTGVFQIKYVFPNGIQGPLHPSPLKPYTGTAHVAFIPETPEGISILHRLETAWQRKLIFTIGTSTTTGRTDTVIWKIHHITNKHGGKFGFPAPDFIKKISDQLTEVGV